MSEPNELIAKENLHLSKEPRQKKARTDDNTVRTSNRTPGDASIMSDEATCRGPLTFDPSPPREEEEDIQLAAADDQAELMRWHYCLGHLSFPSLKAMALNGKIPRKLAKAFPQSALVAFLGQ